MKRRNKIVLVLAILLLLVLGLWFFLGGSGDGSDEQDDVVDIQAEILKCEKQKALFQAECFEDLAVMAKDPLLCERVSEVEDISYESSGIFINEGVCVANVAKKLDNDFSLCDQVKDVPEQYDMCFDLVTITYVKEHKDLSYCDNIRGDSYWWANCLVGGVETEADISVCDNVTGGAQAVCYDEAYETLALNFKDVSYCDKAQKLPSSRPSCIATYARKNDELDLCDTLDSDESICICYNSFFSEIDEAVCDGLSDETQIQSCWKCLELDLFKNL